MRIIGIICEYNPFHNGHKYQIDKIKSTYPNSIIISIMSGNFTQRGDFSIINKYDKARIALENGVDIIVEIPVSFATQGADVFAKEAVAIANKMGCNKLCFGSEHDDINYFYNNIKISNSKNYNNLVKKLLKEGYNYPSATSNALKQLGGNNINLPNDILSLRYIKEIINNNYNIEPIIIKRTNDYHDTISNNKIISASNIRNKIINNINIKDYIPNNCYNIIINNDYIPNINDYFNLFKYIIITNKDNLCEYIEMNKSLSSRFIKYIYISNNFDELINNIKSKNITTSKIKRVILHVLLNIKTNNTTDYINLLGFNSNGKAYLNKIKNNVKLINKFSDYNIEDKNNELLYNYIYYYKIYNKDIFDMVIRERAILK